MLVSTSYGKLRASNEIFYAESKYYARISYYLHQLSYQGFIVIMMIIYLIDI